MAFGRRHGDAEDVKGFLDGQQLLVAGAGGDVLFQNVHAPP